ncbi:MAG: hypothetical protein CSA96_05125 [Bacteroidetes bacterium]|nr:MAG: hypothetical protein CSA96_05125 [Bacteroidota bacterium]
MSVYPSLYLGPLNYYARLLGEDHILIEHFDHYSKQSYRNRCRILGPNGAIDLSIPVLRKHGSKTLMKDVGIDYNQPWNRIHWKSLEAAYASSPYFEYIVDELAPLYEKHFRFLVDLNCVLLELSLNAMNLRISYSGTEAFTPIKGSNDPREFIHPKKNLAQADPAFLPQNYHQVFSDRHGFQQNLSIIDLICNTGPEASSILKQSIRLKEG